jgi:hypothetical protein
MHSAATSTAATPTSQRGACRTREVKLDPPAFGITATACASRQRGTIARGDATRPPPVRSTLGPPRARGWLCNAGREGGGVLWDGDVTGGVRGATVVGVVVAAGGGGGGGDAPVLVRAGRTGSAGTLMVTTWPGGGGPEFVGAVATDPAAGSTFAAGPVTGGSASAPLGKARTREARPSKAIPRAGHTIEAIISDPDVARNRGDVRSRPSPPRLPHSTLASPCAYEYPCPKP